MGSPARRLWTFHDLDRTKTYGLWFNPLARRWDVTPAVLRPAPAGLDVPAGPPQRSAPDRRARGPQADRSTTAWPTTR